MQRLFYINRNEQLFGIDENTRCVLMHLSQLTYIMGVDFFFRLSCGLSEKTNLIAHTGMVHE